MSGLPLARSSAHTVVCLALSIRPLESSPPALSCTRDLSFIEQDRFGLLRLCLGAFLLRPSLRARLLLLLRLDEVRFTSSRLLGILPR